jgi:hypothetical protein
MPEEFKLRSEDVMPPKKNYKKAIIISAVVAVVFILGILGFFGWKKYSEKQKNLQALQEQVDNLKKEGENTTTQPVEQVYNTGIGNAAVTDNQATDDYAGWNTYTNTEIGYQLKYPTDWTVKEIAEFSDLIGSDVKYITITTGDKKYFLYFGLKEKNDNFAISDRTGVGAGDLIQESSVTILGTDTAVKKLVYKSKVKEYFFPGTGSVKTADGKYYFGASFSPGSGASYDALNMLGIPELAKAKLILASVKIIPRTVSQTGCSLILTSSDKLNMKDWKTFKNDKYGYSFKYPKEWTYDKTSDKLIDFKNGPDGEVFSWRSDEMTALGFEGWEPDGAVKNLKVACQSAKSTYLQQGIERMIFTQFKKDGKNHMTNFGYKYVGASISSDLIEEYDLILKSIEFKS